MQAVRRIVTPDYNLAAGSTGIAYRAYEYVYTAGQYKSRGLKHYHLQRPPVGNTRNCIYVLTNFVRSRIDHLCVSGDDF